MESIALQLNRFDESLRENLRTVSQREDWPECLPPAVESLQSAITELGDGCAQQLAEAGPEAELTGPLLASYVGNYHWPERAKAFLLLWRDVLFENQKAQLLAADQQITAETHNDLHQRSLRTLREASVHLREQWWNSIEQLRQSDRGITTAVEEWKAQQNPWPAYREQLAAIPPQCRQLTEQQQLLLTVQNQFAQLHQHLKQLLATRASFLGALREGARDTLRFIEEESEEKASKVATHTEEVNNRVHLPPPLREATRAMENYLEDLPERMTPTIASAQGLLLTKDFYFQRQVRQWMEAEVWPQLYELGEITERNTSAYQVALANIANRARLVPKDQGEGQSWDADNLVQPLQVFSQKIEADLRQYQDLQEQLRDKIATEFLLSLIYEPQREFLPLPLQSTLNLLRSNQNALWIRLRKWLQPRLRALQRLRSSVEQEDVLSQSEKIVRFVQHHRIGANNQHYCSIFLTRGYLGESFWVGRAAELDRAAQIINQWRGGFRGALLLSGQRLCGKTLFGEILAKRHFPQRIIRLQPNSSIEVQGRTHQTTYDLRAALNFIQKYTLTDRPLVWIDDLELWSSTQIPLQQNARALSQHIDDFSSRIFYLVSTSNWLLERLDRSIQISKVFQTEINLDRMKEEEVRNAILTRHGATHKMLINREGEEIGPPQFKRMTRWVHRAAEGNIGEALHDWAFSIKPEDQDRVRFRSTPPALPDFLHPDLAILLTSLLLAKRSNERRLRKLFGPSFKERYQSSLQRLISVGLLQRRPDGWLELNEAAANSIGRQLERKKYLKFHH
ncbi:MAG: hypothetical protein AAFW73_19790 [Bacteroidota bacterium]